MIPLCVDRFLQPILAVVCQGKGATLFLLDGPGTPGRQLVLAADSRQTQVGIRVFDANLGLDVWVSLYKLLMFKGLQR